MGKTKTGKIFHEGNFVFAKLQGYCAWPSKIIKCHSKYRHKVFFYGTGETANVKRENLFMYAEKKTKFANPKTMKRAIFAKSIAEIENAISGEDIADSFCNVPGNISSADGEGTSPQKDSVGADAVADYGMKVDDDLAESLPTTSQAATGNANPGRSRNLKTKATDELYVVADTEEVSSPKKKCTIHPETFATTDKKVAKATEPITKFSPMLKRTKPFNIVNDLLMVYLPTARSVGIKLYSGKPEFENEEEEKEWMERTLDRAMTLKIQLESGQINMEWIKDYIVEEPTKVELSPKENNDFIEDLMEHKYSVFMERDFLEISQQIRSCLGVHRANVGLCLQLLEQYKGFKLNKLMLLRNPESVDLIRRLRRYVGNLGLWNLSEIDRIEFEKQVKAIRNTAAEIYESIKNLFDINIPGARNFWEAFSDMVVTYKMYSKKEAAENASHSLANDGEY